MLDKHGLELKDGSCHQAIIYSDVFFHYVWKSCSWKSKDLDSNSDSDFIYVILSKLFNFVESPFPHSKSEDGNFARLL